MKFKWSKYNHIFDKLKTAPDYVAIFNSLSMEVAYLKTDCFAEITNALARHIDNESIIIGNDLDDTFQRLRELGLILPATADEAEYFDGLAAQAIIIEPLTLRLQMTDFCNLDCTYCQIERNYFTDNKQQMTPEIAIKSMETFARLAPENQAKTIIFTGGEPLLNYETLKLLVREVPRYLRNYRLVLFTNAVLVNEEIARFLKEHDVLTLVSLDGPEPVHNQARGLPNHQGSFRLSLQGYKLCKQAGCKTGISGVVGKHNIAELDETTLDFFLNSEPVSIGLNYPHYLLGRENPELIPIEQYTAKMIAVFLKSRAAGLYLENICRVIMPFVRKKARGKECAALGKGITVMSDGRVGPCKTLLVSGIIAKKLDDLLKINSLSEDDLFRQWGNRSTFTLDACRDCVAVSLCGTGCTYDSYVLRRDIAGIDPRNCVFTKTILDFLINDLFGIISAIKTGDNLMIPTETERRRILGNISLGDQDLQRSAGHDKLMN